MDDLLVEGRLGYVDCHVSLSAFGPASVATTRT